VFPFARIKALKARALFFETGPIA